MNNANVVPHVGWMRVISEVSGPFVTSQVVFFPPKAVFFFIACPSREAKQARKAQNDLFLTSVVYFY